MSNETFRLQIPVERWRAAEEVPAAASEALELASTLRDRRVFLEFVNVDGQDLPLRATKLQVVSNLRYRHDQHSFTTQLRVKVIPADEVGNLGSVEVGATVSWSAPGLVEVMPDTARTYALSFGCLDALPASADMIEKTLVLLGVEAEVEFEEAVRQNIRAVYDTAGQPPMSSPKASPLNPYALEGIPGREADKWANHGFSAEFASMWRDQGFDPDSASEWLDEKFGPEDAADWSIYVLFPEEAAAWRDYGITKAEARDWISLGLDVYDAAALVSAGFDLSRTKSLSWRIYPETLVALHDVVEVEEMEDWQSLLEGNDLLGGDDVKRFLEAGVTAHQAMTVPGDRTAGEILAYLEDPDDSSDLDDPEGGGDGEEVSEESNDLDEFGPETYLRVLGLGEGDGEW